jgi:hypothetical protein
MRHFYLIAAWMLLAATFTSGQTNVEHPPNLKGQANLQPAKTKTGRSRERFHLPANPHLTEKHPSSARGSNRSQLGD